MMDACPAPRSHCSSRGFHASCQEGHHVRRINRPAVRSNMRCRPAGVIRVMGKVHPTADYGSQGFSLTRCLDENTRSLAAIDKHIVRPFERDGRIDPRGDETVSHGQTSDKRQTRQLSNCNTGQRQQETCIKIAWRRCPLPFLPPPACSLLSGSHPDGRHAAFSQQFHRLGIVEPTLSSQMMSGSSPAVSLTGTATQPQHWQRC
jgi:hypothetical protein